MATYEKVTAAWHKIHEDHPEIHFVANPKLINRMKHRDFPKIIQSTCGLQPGSSVLEAGCGSGRDSLFFSYLGYQCTAVDINESPLRKLADARTTLSTDRFTRPLSLAIELADIFQLPYADNTFDLVFNSGVIEHYDVPTGLRLLSEMSRVTKPGSFVAVVFPNKEHLLENYWSSLIGRWTDFPSYDIPEQPLGSSFVNSLHQAGVTAVLVDWIDCYDTISHYPNWLPLRAASYAATVCLPRPPLAIRKRMGTRVIVIARKQPNPPKLHGEVVSRPHSP